MALETTIMVGLSATKGSSTINPGTTVKQIDMSGTGMMQSTVGLTAGATAITFAGVTGVPAAVKLLNLDSTYNIIVSGENAFAAVLQLTLKPGVPNLICPVSATMFAKMSGVTPGFLFIEAVQA